MEKIIDWVSRKTLWIVLVPALIVIIATVSVPIYKSIQSNGVILSYDINGSIGDFFGGIMNPIVALVALVWLVKGVTIQQRELEDTKKALRDSADAQKRQIIYSEAMLQMSALTALINSSNNKLSVIEARLLTIDRAISVNPVAAYEYGHEKNALEIDQELLARNLDHYIESIEQYLSPKRDKEQATP